MGGLRFRILMGFLAMTREQLAAVLGTENVKSPLDELSDREVEVVSLIGQGNPSSFICRELMISAEELAALKKGIMGKCQLKDEVGLVRFAAKQRNSN
jgi:DNA-binding NarL/FixJ family response regulator